MIMNNYDLSRFIEAQKRDFETALQEIKNGRKQSHWMWYIFPQLSGLGRSNMAEYYAMSGIEEAKQFLQDEYLGANLIEISQALLDLKSNDARAIMGSPDHLKLKSSMTLFLIADPTKEVFKKVLDKFYYGDKDEQTLKLLGMEK